MSHTSRFGYGPRQILSGLCKRDHPTDGVSGGCYVQQETLVVRRDETPADRTFHTAIIAHNLAETDKRLMRRIKALAGSGGVTGVSQFHCLYEAGDDAEKTSCMALVKCLPSPWAGGRPNAPA